MQGYAKVQKHLKGIQECLLCNIVCSCTKYNWKSW